jgi:hypothetical protein
MIEPAEQLDRHRSRGLGVVRLDFGTGNVAHGHHGGALGYTMFAARTESGRCVVLWQNGTDLHGLLSWDTAFIQAALRGRARVAGCADLSAPARALAGADRLLNLLPAAYQPRGRISGSTPLPGELLQSVETQETESAASSATRACALARDGAVSERVGDTFCASVATTR